jgi:hypothetical protein
MVEHFRIFEDSRSNVKRGPVVILAYMRTPAVLPALVLLVSACTLSVDGADPPTTTTTRVPTTSPATETIDPAQDASDPPCLQGDRPFSSSGVISAFGGATGDAAQVSGIRTGLHAACERIIVDLLTVDGAPAGSVGLVGVDYEETVGVVRINLPPAVRKTAVADLRLDGELADRAFVVQTAADNLALDIHVVAGRSVALRAFEEASPSRIVVDLRPDSDSAATIGAAVAPDVVVTNPPAGSGGVPLVIDGYSRSDTPVVEARLHESRDADPVAVESTIIDPSPQAWTEFEVTFYDPPRGNVELHVGSAGDGLWLSVDNGPLQLLGGEDA